MKDLWSSITLWPIGVKLRFIRCLLCRCKVSGVPDIAARCNVRLLTGLSHLILTLGDEEGHWGTQQVNVRAHFWAQEYAPKGPVEFWSKFNIKMLLSLLNSMFLDIFCDSALYWAAWKEIWKKHKAKDDRSFENLSHIILHLSQSPVLPGWWWQTWLLLAIAYNYSCITFTVRERNLLPF